MGILFDNIRGGEFEVRNRKHFGTGHGWAGAQIMYWNCESTPQDNNRSDKFIVSSPPAGINWAIGTLAANKSGDGVFESTNTTVTAPRSLYLAQLQERLDINAIRNVTTAGQSKEILVKLNKD